MDDALSPVLRAVRILADDAYEIAGRRVQVGRTSPPAWAGHVPHPEPRVEQLRQDLYQHAYVARIDGALVEPGPEPEAVDEAAASAMATALSAANATRERWDAGWVIRTVMPDGAVAAQKGDRVRLLMPGEFHMPGARGAMPMPEVPILARVERESWTMQPGYYFAFGEELGDSEEEHGAVRVYWNVRSEGATALLGAITSSLNRFQIPFRFKCPVHPPAFRRIDAAVLYLARRHYEIASELLAGVHSRLADRLDTDVPLFTKRLAHGLALAEDPGGGESFGTHRCRILAEAIWEAHREGEQDDARRLARVRAAFARYGIDPDRPYLGPRSQDVYGFPGLDGGAR
ncbi:MAG: hypothetical protein A2W29_02150 [Gemmatimonadetes bacterium RBG_16_66_8]|nr:MAG: hypothetical protein A2W29_02150 [Gemmatimonadetes bacterium RBG_16_66_8]